MGVGASPGNSSTPMFSHRADLGAKPLFRALDWGSWNRFGRSLENHNRRLPGSERRIAVQLRIYFPPTSPQPRPFLSPCSASRDHSAAVDKADACNGIGLEVEPPRRIAISPAVHRHRHQVRTIFDVPEDHAPLLAGTTPGGGQTHGAPTIAPRSPQSDSASCNAVYAPVGGPGEPNKPSGRNPRLLFMFVRHGGPIPRD